MKRPHYTKQINVALLTLSLCLLPFTQANATLGSSSGGSATVLLLPTAPNSVIDLSSNANALMLPAGTTAQRPSVPNLGEIRYNTTIGSVEAYEGSSPAWVALTGGGGGGGTMVYPGAGVPYSTGTAWGTSYAVGTAANDLVQLNSSGQLPAVSAANLTNFPTFNQSTTGNAATATALAATPTGCPAGQAPTGILANGNATGCAAIGAVGGSGTVTTVSVATANGVSGSVANATTTPAITLNLGAITPTSVAATGAVSGTTGTFTGGVVGNVTGNVTGNVSGSSSSTTGNAATVTTNANLTGPITSTGNATAVASQTGTGSTFVMSNSPTLVTPSLGTPSSLNLANATGSTIPGGGTGATTPSTAVNNLLSSPASGTYALACTGSACTPTPTSTSSAPNVGNATGVLALPNGGSGLVAGLTFNSSAAAGANTTAINTALAQGGHVKIDCAPSAQVVYTNAPLVVYSNTDFEIKQGCTIRQASGTSNTVITNHAAQAAWTVVYDNTGTISTGPLNITSQPSAWSASASYSVGAERSANGGIYWESASTCTSASSGGPSGTGTGITDGTCSWNYVTAVTPVSASSPYSPNARATYYPIVHIPSHGLTSGDFVWINPEPDNSTIWTGSGSAGALGGPADSAYFGVFYVVAVNDANYVTVELRRAPTSTFTGIPIEVKKADDNIKIGGGGTIDYNYAQNNTAQTPFIMNDSVVLWGIHNLIMDNLTGINSYKYYVDVGALYSADIGHVQGGSYWTQTDGVNGDQVHVYGPAFDVVVHDENGGGYDDTMVFSTSENLSPTNNSTQILGSGDIYNVVARNIKGFSGERLGLFQSQATGLLRMQQVTLDNIETYWERTQVPSIFIGGAGAFNDITVENSSNKNSGQYFMGIGSSGVGITIDRLNIDHVNAVDNNAGFLEITNSASAPITITDLSLTHDTWSGYGSAVAFLQTSVASGTALSITNLNIDDASTVSGQYLLDWATGTTVTHASITNSNLGGELAAYVTNALNGDYTFANNRIYGGKGFYLNATSTAVVHFDNNAFSGVSGIVYYDTGASSSSLKVYANGNSLTSGATWFTYGSSPTTTVYGWDISCDVTKMTRTTGEFCMNTNTAPGSGTLTTAGPVMDQGTTSNSWFLMSNPSGQQY